MWNDPPVTPLQIPLVDQANHLSDPIPGLYLFAIIPPCGSHR